jgi:hypothetical protein
MVLSMLVAFCAACCFATGNALQHRAAGRVPAALSPPRMILALVRSPQWLIGSVGAFSAFVLHAVALNLGVVAVVQPFMLGAVLLAVPVRAMLDRHFPTRRELRWVLFTVVGLVFFVSVANTQRQTGAPHEGRGAFYSALTLGLAMTLAVSAKRFDHKVIRAFVLAAATGLIFGTTAGMMKFIRYDTADGAGIMGFLTSWHFGVLLVGSVVGTTLNQRAYQTAALSASMPAMNVIDVVVAVGFGWVVFAEAPSLSPVSLTVQVLCLAMTGFGLLQVARAQAEIDAHSEAQLAAQRLRV